MGTQHLIKDRSKISKNCVMLGSYAIQFFDQTMCVSLWIRWLHCASFLTLAHCYQGSSLQGTKWKILGNTNSTNSTYFTQLFKQTIIDEKKNWEKTNDRYKRKRLYIAQNAYPYPVFARLQGLGAFQRNRTALQLKKKSVLLMRRHNCPQANNRSGTGFQPTGVQFPAHLKSGRSASQ